jgi:hypothetical protein
MFQNTENCNGMEPKNPAGIDRGSRPPPGRGIAKRARGDVVGDQDQDAGIENSDRLLWEAGGKATPTHPHFINQEDESQSVCGLAYPSRANPLSLFFTKIINKIK